MKKQCNSCGQVYRVAEEEVERLNEFNIENQFWCPDCRLMRKMARRNERSLYKRPCDLCKKNGISMYPTDAPFTVYCNECFWGDGWSPETCTFHFRAPVQIAVITRGLL